MDTEFFLLYSVSPDFYVVDSQTYFRLRDKDGHIIEHTEVKNFPYTLKIFASHYQSHL